MRVIGGALRGRRLDAPEGASTRPTADRVREAIFSILQGEVEGAAVLDLFAGSGAMGLEALSRGAAHALFVDFDRGACAVIRANLESLGLEDRADIACTDTTKLIATEPSTGPFDLIFIDPPYRIGAALAAEVIATADLKGWIAPRAHVVVEHAAAAGVDPMVRFELDVEKKYGDSAVSVFRKGE